jgi:hypothetical protein
MRAVGSGGGGGGSGGRVLQIASQRLVTLLFKYTSMTSSLWVSQPRRAAAANPRVTQASFDSSVTRIMRVHRPCHTNDGFKERLEIARPKSGVISALNHLEEQGRTVLHGLAENLKKVALRRGGEKDEQR